jgi:hypothetical protein
MVAGLKCGHYIWKRRMLADLKFGHYIRRREHDGRCEVRPLHWEAGA